MGRVGPSAPLAELAGLLHPLVIDELDLGRRGLRWIPAEAGLFVPFEDGTSVQRWEDDARCKAEIAARAPSDVAGQRAVTGLIPHPGGAPDRPTLGREVVTLGGKWEASGALGGRDAGGRDAGRPAGRWEVVTLGVVTLGGQRGVGWAVGPELVPRDRRPGQVCVLRASRHCWLQPADRLV